MSSQVLSPQASRIALSAWVRLLRGHASATRELSAQLQAEHGLTINDYEALLHLSRADGRSMRRVDLAEQLLLTASGVTRLLDGVSVSNGLGWSPDGRTFHFVDSRLQRLGLGSLDQLSGIAEPLQCRHVCGQPFGRHRTDGTAQAAGGRQHHGHHVPAARHGMAEGVHSAVRLEQRPSRRREDHTRGSQR